MIRTVALRPAGDGIEHTEPMNDHKLDSEKMLPIFAPKLRD
jgi:hypothetical protein